MGSLPFADDEITPADAFSDLDDNEPDFEEATGNAGASFERFYQRAALAKKAIDHFLAWPVVYAMDQVMLRAIQALDASTASTAASDEPASIGRLRQAVLEHLAQRIAEHLAPPAEWRRPAVVRCACEHCTDVKRFLASSNGPVWRLKAAERARSHVEHNVRNDHCDLDLTTETRGRPYTLVCTKNQASYQARVRQREQDLADQARLTRS